MTSLLTDVKQTTSGTAYYIPIADIRGLENVATGGVLLAYRSDANKFSTCLWANGLTGVANAGRYSTLVAAAGAGLLRDMGRTVVSSSRTFRKVQLVVPFGQSTFGVAGDVATLGSDFLSAYIEVGTEGTGYPAKVAKFGR